MTNRIVAAASALALSFVLASPTWAAPVPGAALTFSPGAFGVTSNAAAAAYCTSTGGVVQTRIPVFGTNDPPSAWLILNGSAQFCAWTSKGKYPSSIYAMLNTLYSTQPTLAALAYYSKLPLPKTCGAGGSNPSSCYCTYLGGSDQFGGANFAGGAWVLKGSTTDILQTCIFPDLSSIDSWGLTYHSAGIIRGINLAKVLRYHHK